MRVELMYQLDILYNICVNIHSFNPNGKGQIACVRLDGEFTRTKGAEEESAAPS